MSQVIKVSNAISDSSEEGSAILPSLIILVVVAVPITMMLGWTSEFTVMSQNYHLPKIETHRNLSALVSCSDTLSAIPISTQCNTDIVVNGLGPSKAVVVNSVGMDINSLEGKRLAVTRIVCKDGRVLHVQLAKPDTSSLKFFDIGKLRCKG
jgi:hypothetical protein